jgi:Flp pilus assembly protein TadG
MARTLRTANPWRRTYAGAAACLRQLKEDCGDALIEFALVLIVFLTLLLGIMGFGQMLYAYHFVSSAAKSAARWAAVNGSTCGPTAVAGTPMDASCNGTGGMNNGPAKASDIQNYVATMAPPGITSATSRLITTPTWPQQPNGPTVCNTTVNAPGCTVNVQVSYIFNFIIPMIGSSLTSVTLSSTSEMVVIH